MNNRLEWWGNTSISATEEYRFGFYDAATQSVDNIIYNAPFYVSVWAAGNDRDDSGTGSHWVQTPPNSGTWVQSTVVRQPDGGTDRFDCIPTTSTAKNIIPVGALEVEDLGGGLWSPSMSTFSSWGPTDDGRIKPDVMAKGDPTFSCISTNNSAYDIYYGTSMAAPSVTGSIQLLREHWSNLEPGTALRASAYKALVIHTADDWSAGSADEGPDYESGWGVMDTRKAADFLTNAWDAPVAERTNWFRSKDSLNSGHTRTLTFYHSADSEGFKVTIAWTDPAAPPSAPSLNPATLRLINDLDLRVTSAEDITYFPWRLNPNSPDAAATKGDNFRDNVEQVFEEDLPAGLYTVQITHKGATLSGGKQIFSIMVSGIAVPVTCFGNTVLTACSGTVSDGSGMSNYSNDLDCSWTISPPGAASVTLTFTEFDTDDFESVEIYDGTDDSAPSLGKYEGANLPPTLSANSGSMHLVFKTDGSGTAAGWSANYSCSTVPICSGNTNITSCSGTITDGSGNFYYGNNLDCSWTISPPGASSVTLNFTEFNTESGFDFVRVYDGNNTSGPLLIPGPFSGSSLPPTLTAASGKMHITFRTGGSQIRSGWSANYSCATTPPTLAATPNNITVNAPAGSGTFSINSNCTWAIANLPAWLSLNPTSGTGNATITYTYATNTATQSRNILLQLNGCNLSPTVEITQVGCTPSPHPILNPSGNQSLCNGNSLTLTVTNPCSGCTVQWSNGTVGNSTTVSTAGTYTAAMSNGCGPSAPSQPVTVTVGTPPAAPTIAANGLTALCTSNPSVVLSVQNPCPGCTVQWSNGASGANITVSAPGSYSASVSNGCGTSSASASIAVTTGTPPTAAFTANPSSGTAGLTVNFSNVSTNATAYSWNFPGGNPSSSTDPNPGVQFLATGTYTVTLTATGPCGTASQTATITVNSGIVPPIANFSTSSTCVQVGAGTLSFADQSQNNPTAWAWQFPGGTPSTSNLSNPTVTYSTPGVYDVILTATNSAGSNTATKLGHITVVDVKAQTVSGGNNICLGASVLLSASGANNFLWQGNGLSSNSGPIVSATPTAIGPTTYTIVGSTGNCVDAPITLTIQVHAVPTINISVSANEICLGQSVPMNAQGADTYEWAGQGLSAIQGASVTATPTLPGSYTYTVKGTANGCTSLVQTVTIQVKTAPMVDANPSLSAVCLGGSVTLTASGASQYSWTGQGLSANSGTTVTATPIAPGTASYAVVGMGNNGCSATTTAQVEVNAVPVVQAFASPSAICLGDTVLLTATGAALYQWDGAAGLLSAISSTVKAVPTTVGTVSYSVVGTSNNCSAAPKNVPIMVESNPLSVNVAVSGCPNCAEPQQRQVPVAIGVEAFLERPSTDF